MDFEFTVNGKPVDVEDWLMEQRPEDSSASLRLSGGATVLPFDTVTIRGDGRTLFEGPAVSVTSTGASVEVEAVDSSMTMPATVWPAKPAFRFGDVIRVRNSGPHGNTFMVIAHDQSVIDVVRTASPFDILRRQYFSGDYWEIAG